MQRVFFIGYHKVATTALHNLFRGGGYVSAHNLGGRLAKQIEKSIRVGKKSVITDVDGYTVYSDMHFSKDDTWIDANEYYKEIYEEFPNAFYILNTRDTNAWVRSRANHRKGKFIERAEKFHNLPRDIIYNLWSDRKDTVEAEMKQYFIGNPRFLVFDVNNDDIDKLVKHVSPEYKLNASDWKVANKKKYNGVIE